MGCVYSRGCIGDICAPREVRVKENEKVKAGDAGVFSPASTDEEGEVRDQLDQLSLTRDHEVGISRLSRVSAQFLPPEGSRTVKVPTGNYELRYSFLSQRGYYPDALDKANQDSFCIHTPFGTSPDDHFFGVFDGHGEFGAQCSQFVKRKLCENLLRNNNFRVDAVEACHEAFLTTNSQLHDDALDDSMSGTTAITVLVRGTTIYVANSGDSRAVLAERRGEDIVAVDLSIDQTPFQAEELKRVKLCGARVLTLDQIEGLKNPDVQCWGTEEGNDGDPPRLWVQHGMYPGTAFTRSIGDSIAETIGVVPNPEIVVLELTPNNPFFVLASDGVFEFLSSQSVVDMVVKHKDPRDACAAIVAESYRLWLQYETRTDDITVIVVQISALTQAAVARLSGSDAAVLRPPLPQVVEMSGSESPSVMSWNSRNHRVRHDVSKARLRAIETSLEKGQMWVPSSPAHRKTWEEEAHIQRALHDHFLFRKLTDSQCHVLLDCMQRVEVQAGDIVVKQGGEGDCFYVVGSGEFEVLATQEEKNGEVPRILQRYTAEKLSSFGELALMYNKPLQASVRAVTAGTLWALKREDFRGILVSEFSNLSSLKLLRSVDLLSRLTILQLSHIADSLSEVSFFNGQTIVEKNEDLMGLYIVQQGMVKILFDMDSVKNSNATSLMPENQEDDRLQNKKMFAVEKSEGSYFGEWILLGEHIASLRVTAVGDVTCAVLTKEKFDSVVGPLAKLSQDDPKPKDYPVSLSESMEKCDASTIKKVQLSDLEWRMCLFDTDCSETGLVCLRDSDRLLSLKRFSKQKIKRLGRQTQVLKDKNLIKYTSPCAGVPRVICTCADQTHAGILLDTRLACSLASILHSPFDEPCARFCAASVVTALEDLHKNGILYRGVSPDVLMFDHMGYIQLVEFKFGKKLSGESDERTFTICGMTDSLAPEIIQGKGHSFPADWWALGTLIYFMLQGEMPFGSWRESELTYARIAKGQFTLPQTLSHDAVDLITKLLEVNESLRLGSEGVDSLKSHPWFNGVDWQGVRDRSIPAPHEVISRINQHMESPSEDNVSPFHSPLNDLEELNTPEWLEDW